MIFVPGAKRTITEAEGARMVQEVRRPRLAIPPLHLPYISSTSPLHLPDISPRSPPGAPAAATCSRLAAAALRAAGERRLSLTLTLTLT